jgi:hypothetical protein
LRFRSFPAFQPPTVDLARAERPAAAGRRRAFSLVSRVLRRVAQKEWIMSDSKAPPAKDESISIAVTPMRRSAEGIWETSERQGAQFFLVELVQDDGEEAEVVVECRDERTAALAARVVAASLAALGLAEASEDGAVVTAFDDDTAAILAENPTPEVAAPSGAWTEEADDDGAPLQ